MSNFINNEYKNKTNYLAVVKYSRGLSDHDYEIYRQSKKSDALKEQNPVDKLEEEIRNIKDYIKSVYVRTASRGDRILTTSEREQYKEYIKLLPEKEEKLAKMKEGKGLVFSASI